MVPAPFHTQQDKTRGTEQNSEQINESDDDDRNRMATREGAMKAVGNSPQPGVAGMSAQADSNDWVGFAPLSSHLQCSSSPFSPLRPPRQLSSSSFAASASAASTLQQTSTQASPASPRLRLSTMSEILSLSLLQLLSVFSFLTSVLAVVCVGSGSLHRLAHRVESGVDTPAPDMSITSGKSPLWNWSGLPVSFSLDSLIGEDEQLEEPKGYVGGTELTRMDWQVSRSRFGV